MAFRTCQSMPAVIARLVCSVNSASFLTPNSPRNIFVAFFSNTNNNCTYLKSKDVLSSSTQIVQSLDPLSSRRQFGSFFPSLETIGLKAWLSLRKRQIDLNLPGYIFNDQLPDHVYLGLEILNSSTNIKKLQEASLLIDEKIEKAASLAISWEEVESQVKYVDSTLLKAIKTVCTEAQDVARYLLEASGKRFRPLLLILLQRALKESIDNIDGLCDDGSSVELTMVEVAELIHTASMLHDDVIDDADLRRGKKASQHVFGNKKTILAGDYLLARA